MHDYLHEIDDVETETGQSYVETSQSYISPAVHYLGRK